MRLENIIIINKFCSFVHYENPFTYSTTNRQYFALFLPMIASITSINIFFSPILMEAALNRPHLSPLSLANTLYLSFSFHMCLLSTKHETLIFAPWKIVFKIGLSDARVCRGKIISTRAASGHRTNR